MADAARIAALEIRALTGFEAVLVYRFDADWNGEAVAEDKAPDWSRSLLGLRFPASDIPAQARALYTKAKSRFVIDRDSVPVGLVAAPGAGNGPIDLTFAQHRTLSPIHLEYQRNLGVNGSMSISIMVEGRLWGLMIGHHRRPHYVTPETRAAATVLTDAFAMRVQEIESRRLWAERQAHLDVEGRLVRGLTRSDDFVAALTGGTTTLLDLFSATGAGIVSGDAGHADRPDAASRRGDRRSPAWLRTRVPAGEFGFSSNSFTADYPEAGPYREIASGLLATFVDASRENLLLWFRPEVPSTVTWGGDPRKPVLAGSGPVAVLPRRSFERWVEERTGFAAPLGGMAGPARRLPGGGGRGRRAAPAPQDRRAHQPARREGAPARAEGSAHAGDRPPGQELAADRLGLPADAAPPDRRRRGAAGLRRHLGPGDERRAGA